MPRLAKELGPLQVKRLNTPGYYAVGGVAGLLFQISKGGTKSWVLRAKVGLKRREIGLGAYPGVGLALAREKAQQIRDSIAAGVDPVAQREAVRQSVIQQQLEEASMNWTFQRCAEAYIESKAPGWRNVKHGDQWRNTLATYVYPVIGEVLVRNINIRHVTSIVEPYWLTKNETINRVRNRIELVLDWASARQLRSGDNPARWKGNLDKLLPTPSSVAPVKGHPALSADEMFGFIERLKGVSGTAARCLEFVTLTACRSGEARLAAWPEMDLITQTWNIPGPRMKSGRPHRVPLSKEIIALLETLPRFEGTDLLFPGRQSKKPLSDMAMTKVMRDMKLKAVPHGFRSTFSSWCASSTSYPSEVREMALAHVIGDSTVSAYQRSDLFEKRRNLMSDWAKFVTTAPIVGDNIISLHGGMP